MQNRSAPKSKSWTDIQMIISSIAIAITLGLWSLFSGPQKKNASVTGEVIVPPQPQNTSVVTQPQLAPGQKLLFGGTAPRQKVVVVNGGGGGGGGAAPAANGGGGGGNSGGGSGGGTGTS